jgi:hypothetical protein
MDDETQRLIQIRNAKLSRLRLLEVQQARQGDDTPPHVVVEIEGLRRALGLVDAAVSSPLTPDVVEALGQSGRYMATDTRLNAIERSIARWGAQWELFIEESMQWRRLHWLWLVIITVVIVIVLLVLVAGITYVLTKGSV